MTRKLICFLVTAAVLLTQIQPLWAYAAGSNSKEVKVTPMVSAGCSFSAVLMPDGTVWDFGVNELSELGNGKISTSSKPTRVLGLRNVVSIDCASKYTLALKSDGTVWGWGFNNEYGLGNGKPLQCYYAVKITGIKDAKAVQAGDGMVVFLKKNGTVWYYYNQGANASGLKQFKNLKDIIQISFQHTRGIALSKDGHIWTFGCDYTDHGAKVSLPKKESITNVKSVDTGDYHYIIQKKDNSIWLWGNNNDGQIGNGSTNYCYQPTQLKKLKNVKLYATGMYFTLAVTRDNSFYAWGENQSGQFGNKTRKSSLSPIKTSNLKDVIAMDGGYYHTIALKSNGDVMVMGYNNDGILGIGGNKDQLTPYKIMNINDKAYQSSDNNIYADGNLTDWGKVSPIAQGSSSEVGGKLKGIKTLYAKMDKKYLYLAADVTGGIPANVNFSLDIDGDKKKEYQINYLDRNYPEIYVYQDGKKVEEGKEDIFGVNSDILEVKIALFGIGNAESIHITAAYGADKKKYKVNSAITSWKEVPGSKKANTDKSSASSENGNSSSSKEGQKDLTASGNASKKVKIGKITLDGKLDDWNTMEKTTVEDPKDEVAQGGADLQKIYAAKDSKYLYLAVQATGKTPVIFMKFDYDGDKIVDYGATGDTQAGNVYLFDFISENKVIEAGKNRNIALGEVVEMAIPLSEINNPENISIHIWSKHDNGSDNESIDDELDGFFQVVNIS